MPRAVGWRSLLLGGLLWGVPAATGGPHAPVQCILQPSDGAAGRCLQAEDMYAAGAQLWGTDVQEASCRWRVRAQQFLYDADNRTFSLAGRPTLCLDVHRRWGRGLEFGLFPCKLAALRANQQFTCAAEDDELRCCCRGLCVTLLPFSAPAWLADTVHTPAPALPPALRPATSWSALRLSLLCSGLLGLMVVLLLLPVALVYAGRLRGWRLRWRVRRPAWAKSFGGKPSPPLAKASPAPPRTAPHLPAALPLPAAYDPPAVGGLRLPEAAGAAGLPRLPSYYQYPDAMRPMVPELLSLWVRQSSTTSESSDPEQVRARPAEWYKTNV